MNTAGASSMALKFTSKRILQGRIKRVNDVHRLQPVTHLLRITAPSITP